MATYPFDTQWKSSRDLEYFPKTCETLFPLDYSGGRADAVPIEYFP